MDLGVARGFRDSMSSEAEKIECLNTKLSELFASRNYRLISTPLLEKAYVFENCKDEAESNSQNLIRLVDTGGDLLSLKSDVTLPIARVVATRFKDIEPPFRLRYSTEVYREQEMLRAESRAIKQTGVEFIGDSSLKADVELLVLAFEALDRLGLRSSRIHINNAGIFNSLVSNICDASITVAWRSELLRFAHQGNFVGVGNLVRQAKLGSEYEQLFELLTTIAGGAPDILKCKQILSGLDGQTQAKQATDRLLEIINHEQLTQYQSRLVADLSIMRDFSYYTGFIFDIFDQNHSSALGGGGRYDATLLRFGRDLPAAGFMLTLNDVLECLKSKGETDSENPQPLRIAIPKGSLFTDAVACLEQVGFDVEPLKDADRVLVVKGKGVEYIIAKPSDVAIYVAKGAADCGIGGKDVLIEADYPLLELVDLSFGACRFVVAGLESEMRTLKELAIDKGVIRVASKYPRTTTRFFDAQGIQADVIKLNGNIEVAPLIGIADLVVDITATGKTLSDNNLKILSEVAESTARFVANPACARSDQRISELRKSMDQLLAQRESSLIRAGENNGKH